MAHEHSFIIILIYDNDIINDTDDYSTTNNFVFSNINYFHATFSTTDPFNLDAIGWQVGWQVGWQAGWLVGWLAGWLAGWAGFLVGMVGCLAGLAGWLAGLLDGDRMPST